MALRVIAATRSTATPRFMIALFTTEWFTTVVRL
jgi:hypothetical protein